MQATTIEITVISYIPITPPMALSPIVPPPTAMKISPSAILPVATPTIRERTVPLISTTNTLIPISAPINTTIYGSICQTLYGNSFVSVKFPFLVIKKKMAIVAIAAGRTIKKLALNLSFISQPCVFTAAMVVSEIMERLSPNIAPHTTAPIHTAIGKPVFSLMPTAIGASAAIVPIEVPIDTDIKQPIINNPTTAILEGRIDKPKFTVLSAPPAAVTAPENPPAQRKIRHIVMIFSSPTPFEITCSFSVKVKFLFCKKATSNAIKNATMAGIV